MISGIRKRLANHQIARSRRAIVGLAGASGALMASGQALRQHRALSGVLTGAGGALATHSVLAAVTGSAREMRGEMRDLWGLSGMFAGEARPLPSPGSWAITADAARYLIRWLEVHGSDVVVELGPGVSSILLTRKKHSDRRFFGLESDPAFMPVVKDLLDYHEVANYKLLFAPLQWQEVSGRSVNWYSQAAIAQLPERIDVLLVDGPPNQTADQQRWPAWPLLRGRMPSGSLVFLDDTSRPDEWETVQSWLQTGGLTLLHRGSNFTALGVK